MHWLPCVAAIWCATADINLIIVMIVNHRRHVIVCTVPIACLECLQALKVESAAFIYRHAITFRLARPLR